MRRPLVAIAFVLALSAPAGARAASLVRVTTDDPAALIRTGFDVTDDIRPGTADVVLYSPADARRLARDGYPYRTLVRSLEAQDRAARAPASDAGRSALPSGRTTYRHYGDYVRALAALAAGHPGLVRSVTLPERTVLGQPIVGVEIATDVNRTDDGRPVYAVVGGTHAREWPSAEVPMEFALDLVHGYGSDPRITSLLQRERVIVVPVLNVDGFQISRENVQSDDPAFAQTASAGELKRKNCEADTPAEQNEPCQDRAGVDLNRNYGAYWGGNGGSPTYTDDDYRGPGPWSEPESRAVHELSQGLQLTGLQSLHSVGGLVLRPPGFRALGLAPDEARLKELGDAMAQSTGYDSEYGYQLYEVTGAMEDWNYVAQGTFGYTIELGGEGFHGPFDEDVVDQYLGTPGTATAGQGVREALLLAAEEAADPADHAIIRGTAPAGRILRLHKDFATMTSPVCPLDPNAPSCPVGLEPMSIPDHVDTTLTVPASGSYVWHVGPSTRPFERKAGHSEAWTLTCETADGTVLERDAVTVWRGQTATVDLACGGPGTSSGPVVTRTPPDPASAAFERRLAGLKAPRPPRGARIEVGRAARVHAGVLPVTVRVVGTSLSNVTAVLRSRDRQVLASAALKRAAPGRSVLRLRVARRGLRAGVYRLSVKGLASNGAPLAAAARVRVRR